VKAGDGEQENEKTGQGAQDHIISNPYSHYRNRNKDVYLRLFMSALLEIV
jgi:hypothetical protein